MVYCACTARRATIPMLMAPEARPPKVNAMLLCERVIREDGSGLVSLISIFENINGQQLPARLATMFVYAKLTEAQGDYLFKLEVIRRRDMKSIAEVQMPEPMTIDDPMVSVDMIMRLDGLSFTELGHYDFSLGANGRFIESKSVQVTVKSD